MMRKKYISFYFVLLAILFWFSFSIPARAAMVFDNGLVNDFSGVSGGNNPVRDSSSGAITTLNVLNGAEFGNITALDSSQVNVFSGAIINSRLLVTDTSNVEVFGGNIGLADAAGMSNLFISDGIFDQGVRGVNNASITITGGIFTNNGSSPNAISIDQNANLELRGGDYTGRLFFSGGSSLSNTINIFGGSFSEIFNTSGATTTIFGSNFNLPFGEIVSNLDPTLLTGTLADGTALDATISQGGFTSKIVLAPIPLPSAILMFFSGVIGLVSIRHSKRIQA